MNNKIEYNIEVPFFPGYYESNFDPGELLDRHFESDDMIASYIEEYGKDFSTGDIDIDFDSLKEEVGTEYCKELQSYLPPWIISCKYEHTWSPKEYNFETDEVYADCEFKENYRKLIVEFINKHYEKLKDKIYNRWRSRDGFWSHTNHDIDDWIKDIKESESCDEVYLWYLWECWLEYEYFPSIENPYFNTDSLKAGMYRIWQSVLENIVPTFIYEKNKWVNREEQIKENEKFLEEYHKYNDCYK